VVRSPSAPASSSSGISQPPNGTHPTRGGHGRQPKTVLVLVHACSMAERAGSEASATATQTC
jgi:hypothetical protein